MENIQDLLQTDEEVNERDIFLAVCGEDEGQESRCITSIRMCDINVRTNEDVTLDEVVIDTPIVNIYRTMNTTIVDLTFPSVTDFDFINVTARLNYFIKTEFEPLDEEVVRSIVLTLTPKEEYIEYYVTGLYGTYTLMPSVAGGDIDTIRFFFSNELFGTYQVRLSDIEME